MEASKLLSVNPLSAIATSKGLAGDTLKRQFTGWRVKQSAPVDNAQDYTFTLPSMADMIQLAAAKDISLADHVPAQHLINAPDYPAHTFTGEDMDTFLAFLGFHSSAGSIFTSMHAHGDSHSCSPAVESEAAPRLHRGRVESAVTH